MVYDVVIIGGGFGGLLCGTLLGKEGMSVCIVEKNNKPGGCLQTFNRDGVVFDTGVHYIGSLDEGQDLHQLFKYIGIIDELAIEKLDGGGFDRITFRQDPVEYKFAQQYADFAQQLQSYFPRERHGIETYVNKIREISSIYNLSNLSNISSKGVDIQYHEIGVVDYIKSIIKDSRLQSVLGGNNLLYAGNEAETQLYGHAVIMNSFISGSWRFTKGGSQISNLLLRTIRQNGGAVLTDTCGAKFIMGKEGIGSLQTSDGQLIQGKVFISDIHPALTMKMFDPGCFNKTYTQRILNHKNSASAFIVNIVLKENLMKDLNYNRYHHRSDNVWNEQGSIDENWPQMVGIFPSNVKGATNNHQGLSLITYMDYNDLKPWEDTVNTTDSVMNRGIGYDEFKRIHAEKLIDFAQEIIPGLHSKILSYYVSTPLTLRDYIGTPSGSLYGYAKNYKNPLSSFIGPRTKISNFYFTGQNLNLHGLLGVALSAVSTCSEICGIDYLTNKIIRA